MTIHPQRLGGSFQHVGWLFLGKRFNLTSKNSSGELLKLLWSPCWVHLQKWRISMWCFFKCLIRKSGLVQDYSMFVNGVEWWNIFLAESEAKSPVHPKVWLTNRLQNCVIFTSLPPDGLVRKSRNKHGFLYCKIECFWGKDQCFIAALIKATHTWNTQVEWFGFWPRTHGGKWSPRGLKHVVFIEVMIEATT